jgi:RNA polymerase sigma-70 factor (ECF subfamily)
MRARADPLGAGASMTDEPEKHAAAAGDPEPHEIEGQDVRALVDRAKAGDAGALNELFARYQRLLVDVARRRLGAKLRAKLEPDDLAQTTFREATRDFGQYSYQGEDSLLRWLIQILHNKIKDKADYYSARKRESSRERTMEVGTGDEARTLDFAAHDLSVTRQVSREEEFEILRKGLERLSPDHRTAITLVFFQGLQLREAGERMGGRTEDAVRMLLRRAEERLRDIVAGRLEESTGDDA